MDCERSVRLRLRWNCPGRVFADSDDRRPESPAREEPLWLVCEESSTRVEDAGEKLAPAVCAKATAVSTCRGYGREEPEGPLGALQVRSTLAARPDATDMRDRTLLGVELRFGREYGSSLKSSSVFGSLGGVASAPAWLPAPFP